MPSHFYSFYAISGHYKTFPNQLGYFTSHDSDECLTKYWGSGWTCDYLTQASYKIYCDHYRADVRRCCPSSCGLHLRDNSYGLAQRYTWGRCLIDYKNYHHSTPTSYPKVSWKKCGYLGNISVEFGVQDDKSGI